MGESLLRRLIPMGLLLLVAACEPQIAPTTYRFTTTDESREPFLTAIRTFAADEGLRLKMEVGSVGEDRIQVFTLEGWRTQILMQSEYDGNHTIANQFRASVLSTQDPMPWALRHEELNAFAAKFENALVSVPGVEVERIQVPEEFL